MTHEEIQESEFVERYVRHQLAPEERRAFQEHFFACDECFEQVQTTARFVAGAREASRRGVLAEGVAEPAAWWASLFRPAFGLALATALVLIVVVGWLVFRQAPPQEMARDGQPSPTPAQTSTPAQGATPSPTPSPSPQRNERPKQQVEPDLQARNHPPEEMPGRTPSVLLESSRDASAGSNQLTLPAGVGSAILRIEVEPGSTVGSFQFQVYDSARRLVATAASGRASARGVVTARIPAGQLQNGKYLVRCYGVRDGRRELVGEYDLHVRRL
ncbi:MAG TPA: zf-HC2 domain-containing protein [Blastocatellia bacterium]|nr:zf-HC2 domain-containing protein [Blastocatellia bacterium]